MRSNTALKLGIKNKPNQRQLRNGAKLAAKMQELREKIGMSMTPTSGFRCEVINKAVGGSSTSRHMKFLALDFNIDGLEPHEGVSLIKKSGVSLDKVFVERGCIHAQICFNDKHNRNFFGTAIKINGEWIVSDKIEKV